jgi:glycosyltransferase involved in cell wall biosynthesis
VVGKVARLAPLKGYEFLIRAIQEILLHVPKAKFLFVGDGPAAIDIRQQVHDAGIQNRVIMAGLVPASHIPLYVSAMDVVVHASLREGLARVIPQAMLLEKPVVAYNLDGTPEAIQDGVTGYIVPAESVHELARRTTELLQDCDKAREMGRRGMEFARQRFDACVMVDKIDRLYQELIGNAEC